MMEMTQQEKDIITGVITNELGVVNPSITNKIIGNLTVQMQGIINRKLVNAIREHLIVADSVNSLSQAQEFLTKCLQSMEEDIIQYEKNVMTSYTGLSTEVLTISDSIDNLTENVNDSLVDLTENVNDVLIKFEKLQKDNAKLLKASKKKPVKEKVEKVEKKKPVKKEVKKVEKKTPEKKKPEKISTIIDPTKPSSPTTDRVIKEDRPPKPSFSDIIITDKNIEPPKPVQKKKPQKTETLIKRDLYKEHEAEKKESQKGDLLTTYLDMNFSDLIKIAKDKQVKIPARSKKDDIAMLLLEG